MVTLHDRALIEAKAKGIDVEASLRSPLRQLLRPDVIISSLGITLFLLVYFTAVGFALIYFTTVFAFSVHDGNALGNWAWGFNFIAVILFGIISDRLGVRKPIMIAGVGAAVMMVVYLGQIGHPTSYYHMAVLAGALTFCLGAAYVPWMASFTETVEAHNPALTATGLAIWGWIAPMVVFVSYLLLPVVVHSVTPVVVYGAEVKAYTARYAPGRRTSTSGTAGHGP
jgi:MFS family permease